MTHLTNHDLVSEMQAFCRKTGLSPTRFGLLATNNRSLMANLASGKTSPTLRTVNRIRSFMSDYLEQFGPRPIPTDARADLIPSPGARRDTSSRGQSHTRVRTRKGAKNG